MYKPIHPKASSYFGFLVHTLDGKAAATHLRRGRALESAVQSSQSAADRPLGELTVLAGVVKNHFPCAVFDAQPPCTRLEDVDVEGVLIGGVASQ